MKTSSDNILLVGQNAKAIIIPNLFREIEESSSYTFCDAGRFFASPILFFLRYLEIPNCIGTNIMLESLTQQAHIITEHYILKIEALEATF